MRCICAFNAFGGVNIAMWDIFSSSHIYHNGKDEYDPFPIPVYVLSSDIIKIASVDWDITV